MYFYFQIKRILPSGAASQSGQLEVGDRLITCNGTSLRGLTQSHCLDIIKSASSCGGVKFEVIRPVYHGNSMEISVTLSNGANTRANSNFDPSQYSVKAQSYDRQGIDVIVTSESEDYLTVSEDEYSKTGRLANIPEEKANEVFVSNSVRLAFQKTVNTIDEESSETDTDLNEQDQPRDANEAHELNTTSFHNSSHSGCPGPSIQRLELPIYHSQPVANPAYISSDSERDQEVPNLPNLQSDLDQISPRSFPQSSNLDDVSPRSPVQASNLDVIGPVSPVSIPKQSRVESSNLVEPSENYQSPYSYTKRQQVPKDLEFTVPFDSPPEDVPEEIPVNNNESATYNPLFEDSNLSEFTDSDTQDIYIASPFHTAALGTVPSSDLDRISLGSNRTITRTDLDAVSLGSDWKIEVGAPVSDSEEITVPPPLEFSDNLDKEQNYLSETDYCRKDRFSDDKKFESDSDNSDLDEAKLAFNSELTAPFDIVLQEQGIGLESEPTIDTIPERDVLQVVTHRPDGAVVISQFEPHSEEAEEKLHPHFNTPNYIVSRFTPTVHDTAMDTNSEAMLKDALDMEYDQMTDANKSESRIKHYMNNNNEVKGADEFDDPGFENHNVVAENIAKDIAKAENGDAGYFLESDDEPDQFPEADAPEDAPDLPDVPPPPLWTSGDTSVSVAVNGEPVNDTDSVENLEQKIVMDSNWSLKTRSVKHDLDGNDFGKDDEIVPLKVQRKVDIPVKFVQSEEVVEKDVIMPENIKRVFELPKEFQERAPSPRQATRIEIDDSSFFEPFTVDTNSNQVKPGTDLNNSDDVEIEEEIISPVEVKKDHSKSLINVINVVSALKARAKDRDPDEMDKISKEDVKSKRGDLLSAVLKIGGNTTQTETQPPLQENIVSSRDTITVSNVTKMQAKVADVGNDVTERNTSVKPGTVSADITYKPDNECRKDETNQQVNQPVMRTSITVEKARPTADDTTKVSSVIPPLDLGGVTSTDSVSSDIGHVGSRSPTASYKTTIGVTKQPESVKQVEKVSYSAKQTTAKREEPVSDTKHIEPSKPKDEKQKVMPTPLTKPLSQIRPLSFNPKSLSQTGSRPVQYKTTISSLGMKSSGLSKPGSVKPDHPIKRMETMPFEVSILKGILGIGIKTTMTPEGFVKVTEILPNGPVGREGNIK